MPKAPILSTKSYEEVRKTALLHNETACLFDSIAEISSSNEDDDETYKDEEGESVNAFASPLSLWELKTGRYTPVRRNSRSLWSRIKWGVMDSICEANGLESRRPQGIYIDGEIELLASKPDMEVSDDGASWYPMAAKNVANTMANMWRNAAGEETPPEYMIIEGHHHMAVTNTDRFYIAVLFGGVREKMFVVHRDEELIEELFAAAQDFWECITEDRRPQPNGDRDATVLARLYAAIDPEAPALDMRSNTEFLSMQEEKEKLSSEKKILEKRIKEINEAQKAALDGYSSAIISDDRQLRWVVQEAKEVAFTRSASAHLRASKINGAAAGSAITELVK